MSTVVTRRIGRVGLALALAVMSALVAPLPAAAAPAELTEVTVIPIPSRGGAGGGMVIDPGLHRIYVDDSMTGRLTLIDTRTNLLVHEYALTLETKNMAVDPVSHRLYIMDWRRNLAIIDGVNLVEMTRVELPHAMSFMEVDSAAGAVWLTDSASGTVTKLDGATGSVLTTVSVGAGAGALAIDPAGSIYVKRVLDGTTELVRLSSATGAVELRMPSPHPWAGGIVVDPTTHTLYTAWATGDSSGVIAEVDPVTLLALRTVAVPAVPADIAVDPGGELWVSGTAEIPAEDLSDESWVAAVDTGTMTVTAQAFRGYTFVYGVELDPEGRGAYFFHNQRLSVVLEALPEVAFDPIIEWPSASECNFVVGRSDQVTLRFFASAAPPPTWTATGNVPPGLAMTRFEIEGSWTDPPVPGSVLYGSLDSVPTGEYRFTVTARNSGGSDSVPCIITVTDGDGALVELAQDLGGELLPGQAAPDTSEPDPTSTPTAPPTSSAASTTQPTQQASSSTTVSVAAVATGPQLSSTGSPLTITAVAASGLLLVGAALTFVARRRRRVN